MTRIRSGDSSMIDDRRGRSGGGFGGMGGFPMGIPGGMKAGGGLLGIIVLVAAVLLPRLLGAGGTDTGGATPGGLSAGSGSSSQSGDAADGTCSSQLEQIVCGATVDVQTYWQGALPQFFGVQYQTTKTVFFSGGTDTGCGAASSETGPFYCPLDNLVYIDLDFMQQLEQQLVGTSTDLAEQYIVAHEYGHHVQNLVGTNAQVQQAQQNDPSRANQYSVALELQADCYAGVWVADVARRNQLDSSGEIQEALNAAAGVGDDRIQQKTQGRIDPETWTHGSAQQRVDWFTRGYQSADPRRCDTFAEVI
jgi:predicted metalloprotease